MTEDLERIGRKLAPDVLRKLADYLESVTAPAQSEMLWHHGPRGIVTRAEGKLFTQFLDARQGKGVESHQT